MHDPHFSRATRVVEFLGLFKDSIARIGEHEDAVAAVAAVWDLYFGSRCVALTCGKRLAALHFRQDNGTIQRAIGAQQDAIKPLASSFSFTGIQYRPSYGNFCAWKNSCWCLHRLNHQIGSWSQCNG